MSQRVLVVDDDPSILRTLRIALRAGGYEVEAVTNGADALSALKDCLLYTSPSPRDRG